MDIEIDDSKSYLYAFKSSISSTGGPVISSLTFDFSRLSEGEGSESSTPAWFTLYTNKLPSLPPEIRNLSRR